MVSPFSPISFPSDNSFRDYYFKGSSFFLVQFFPGQFIAGFQHNSSPKIFFQGQFFLETIYPKIFAFLFENSSSWLKDNSFRDNYVSRHFVQGPQQFIHSFFISTQDQKKSSRRQFFAGQLYKDKFTRTILPGTFCPENNCIDLV